MPSATQMTSNPLEETLMNSYKSIAKVVSVQKMRRIFLGAKASLLGESSLPKQARLHQLLLHRSVEKRLFGQIASLPGEDSVLKELQASVPSRREQEGKPPKENPIIS